MPTLPEQIAGAWRGTNRLYFVQPTAQEFVSETSLHAGAALDGRALEIHYTWAHEGRPHQGLLVVAMDKSGGAANATWMDTFHQQTLMLCEPEPAEAGISVRGSFPAPEGPPWGWRITLRLSPEAKLLFGMDIITPTGEEAPAVRADYERA
ncbi:MAG: DUF1579 family protein [Bryobacteraceae bacterium]|nr:DUF1579 family protein [Bryobacteraceae bacterium]